MSILENLSAVSEQVIKDRNFVNHFLTFRQQRGDRVTEPDSHAIAGELLSISSKKRVKSGASLDKYIELANQRLSEKVADSEFESLLKEMYFENNAHGLYQISPEFLLFKAHASASGNTKHVAAILGNMLVSNPRLIKPSRQDLNFLEVELQAVFHSLLSDYVSTTPTAEDYLPFLSQVFADDMAMLCRHPSYMMQNLKAFIGLYNFLYSAQLALNIRRWTEVPASKPLFFILDTERASAERTHVRDAFPTLKDRVEDLFPVLSSLEYLNQPDSKEAIRYPLWRHYQHLQCLNENDQQRLMTDLVAFVASYRDKRGRPPWSSPIDTLEAALHALTSTAKEIFSQPRSNQQTVNRKVVSAFENDVARHFIQNRNRGGRVLIMNQDYLLLLTNLAIGTEEKIPFRELLSAFRKRGVWFDQQSEQALINFYERVGNLERMSDSGDAVYVRKTI